MTDRLITWLPIGRFAREMGLSPHMARKQLRKVEWAFPPAMKQGVLHWDARALDLLRAMRGQPHRTLEPVHQDWLTLYLKEQADASPAP